jgi:hypothetical protein
MPSDRNPSPQPNRLGSQSVEAGLALNHFDELGTGHSSSLCDAELAHKRNEPSCATELNSEVGRFDRLHEGLLCSREESTSNRNDPLVKKRVTNLYLKGFRAARDIAIQVIETVDTTDRSVLANALRAIHPPTKIRHKPEAKP